MTLIIVIKTITTVSTVKVTQSHVLEGRTQCRPWQSTTSDVPSSARPTVTSWVPRWTSFIGVTGWRHVTTPTGVWRWRESSRTNRGWDKCYRHSSLLRGASPRPSVACLISSPGALTPDWLLSLLGLIWLAVLSSRIILIGWRASRIFLHIPVWTRCFL